MAWVKVQQQDNNATGGETLTATYDSTPTENNLLVACFAYRDTVDPETPPSGWTKAVTENGFSNHVGFWFKIAGASEPTAVTFAWTGAAANLLLITEYSGNATSSPLDVVDGNNEGSGDVSTLSSGTTATTAEDDELWIAGFVVRGGSDGFTSFTNSFTEIFDVSNAGEGLGVAHRLEADIAAAETTGSWTRADRTSACIATFKPSTAVARFIRSNLQSRQSLQLDADRLVSTGLISAGKST